MGSWRRLFPHDGELAPVKTQKKEKKRKKRKREKEKKEKKRKKRKRQTLEMASEGPQRITGKYYGVYLPS